MDRNEAIKRAQEDLAGFLAELEEETARQQAEIAFLRAADSEKGQLAAGQEKIIAGQQAK